MKTLLLVLLSFASAASADNAPAKPTEVTLAVHSMATTRPALRYRLLPELADRTPGNAATLYLMAGEIAGGMSGAATAEVSDDVLTKWLSGPADQIPREQANKAAADHSSSLHYLDLAARRERCDWGLPVREDGFNALLPHLTSMRQFARLLALRARLQILDGNYDAAARTLQTGFSMARDLNNDAFLVQALVAAAVNDLMLDQVELWVSRPGAPNLYWPLTDLPRPLCDLRGGYEHERLAVFSTFPHFREALAGRLTDAQLAELLDALQHVSAAQAAGDKAARMADLLPAAAAQRQYLESLGYTAKELDAMTPAAIAGLYLARGYDDATQEAFKLAGLTPWEAASREDATDAESRQLLSQNPFVSILLPTRRAATSMLRPTRHVEQLRALESIRAYAAAHDGQLPAKLSDLSLPAPIDPATGQPFIYTPRADGFTLTAPLPTGGTARDGRVLDVHVEK